MFTLFLTPPNNISSMNRGMIVSFTDIYNYLVPGLELILNKYIKMTQY